MVVFLLTRAQNLNLSFDVVTEKVLEKIEKKEIIPEDEVEPGSKSAGNQDRVSIERRKRFTAYQQSETSRCQESVLWRKLIPAEYRGCGRSTANFDH